MVLRVNIRLIIVRRRSRDPRRRGLAWRLPPHPLTGWRVFAQGRKVRQGLAQTQHPETVAKAILGFDFRLFVGVFINFRGGLQSDA